MDRITGKIINLHGWIELEIFSIKVSWKLQKEIVQ